MKPLNPKLFAALKREFGRVSISNEGLPMTATYLPGLEGKPRLTPVSTGEYYRVVCPYCHDTSGHLYINHRWGVRDPMNHTRNLWLACCFLSDCLNSWESRLDLAERLEEYTIRAKCGGIAVPETVEAPLLTCYVLPDDFQLLADLSPSHVSCRYVTQRDFSPKELSDLWGVGYSADAYRYFGRLVIPMRARLSDYDDDQSADAHRQVWDVVGYQGRSIKDDDEPKYLTTLGTRKSYVLYGLDRVPLDQGGPVVICEGPTDVWRAGPGAVAIFGKNISEAQCKLLRAVLPGRDIVVMLDPDAVSEAGAMATRIRDVLARDLCSDTCPGRVVVARLPDERDPGDCTREEIWTAVKEALSRGK